MKSLLFRIKLTGGLGNQIFQYLAAERLRKTFPSASITFAPSDYILKGYRDLELTNIFDISIAPIPEETLIGKWNKLLTTRHQRVRRFYKEHFSLWQGGVTLSEDEMLGHSSGPALLSAEAIIKKNIRDKKPYKKAIEIVIDGFWQDFLPYIEISNIRLRTNTEPLGIAFHSLTPGSYIALHVRRGDYIDEINTHKEFGCSYDSLSYIRNALSLVPSNLHKLPLVICSDDLEWCKLWSSTSITQDFDRVVLQSHSSFDDWRVLQNSRINICSNSTYSVTAAILNNKNKNERIRCFIPCMYSKSVASREKNWHKIPGAYLI